MYVLVLWYRRVFKPLGGKKLDIYKKKITKRFFIIIYYDINIMT